MAYNTRKLAAYATTGLIMATFAILAVQILPLTPTEKTGVLALKITDAPPFMQPTSLNVTIDSIMVHREGFGNETWVTFELDGNSTFDLVSLVNVTDLLGADELPVGNYTQIRMHILDATVSFSEEPEELTVPSDYIYISVNFTIKEHETTIILLDINYDSVVVAAHHHLSPVVHPIVEQQP